MWYSHAIAAQLLLNMDKLDCQFYNENKEFNLWPELFRFLTFRSKTSLPIILYGVFKKFYEIFLRKSFPDILQANENLKKIFKVIICYYIYFHYMDYLRIIVVVITCYIGSSRRRWSTFISYIHRTGSLPFLNVLQGSRFFLLGNF